MSDTKQSKALWSTPSMSLLPGPLGAGVVALVSIGKIDIFDI